MMESFYIYGLGYILGTFQGYAFAKFLEERRRLKKNGKARRLFDTD